MKRLLVGLLLVVTSLGANAQLIYGNTFPFWNVNGPLTVTGTTTLSGTTTLTGATAILGGSGNASAGYVGELLTTAVASGAAVAGEATTASKNLTSVALTAGDWDVSAICNNIGNGITATVYKCGLGTTTATLLTDAGGGGVGTDPVAISSGTHGVTLSLTHSVVLPPVRVSLAATTTIYLVVNNTFSAGSYTMYGTIRARRVR